MPEPEPYEFPSLDDRDEWQRVITEYVEQKKLKWKHVADSQWILEGKCPRCKDSGTSNYYDFEVVTAGTLNQARFGRGNLPTGAATPPANAPEKKQSVTLEFVCKCNVEHAKEKRGCGWGRGLEITLPAP